MTLVSLEPETLESALPIPEEIQREIPLLQARASFVQQSRETIEAILSGWDSRLLLITGPCSIHDPEAALEYGRRLRQLAERVSDRFFVIMRTYFEKPRSIIGWKGMLYDPAMDGSYQLANGIRLTRKLLAELTDMGVPTGSELLEINTLHYYADFLSWGCVGARTCSSPPHRQMVSSLNLPTGFKNSTDGNIDNAVHGILAAGAQHVYMGLSPAGHMIRIQAEGNPLCHVVLRGGIQGPNYHPDMIQEAVKKCQKAKICSRLVIDCSHDNCGKNPEQQGQAFLSGIQQVLSGNAHIAGMMLESHLLGGAQEITFPLRYGVSITDPCLDWQATERLVMQAYSNLSRSQIRH